MTICFSSIDKGLETRASAVYHLSHDQSSKLYIYQYFPFDTSTEYCTLGIDGIEYRYEYLLILGIGHSVRVFEYFGIVSPTLSVHHV